MDSSFSENEILITITIGIIVMLLLAMAFVLFFYFSQKKFQAQQVKAQQQELAHQEALLFGSIQAQENERERIARELHDEVGSKLTAINLGLHRLQKSAGVLPVLGDTLSELFGAVSTAVGSTRRISHDLLPPTLENFGLRTALDELCENYQKASEIKVVFELCQNERPLTDRSLSLSFFRIVQELMSNSFKYAEATLIEVKLWQGRSEVSLTYRDNGKGFDPKSKKHQRGLGMQNIESRLRMIGAEHRLVSEVGKGIFFQIKKQLT